MGRKLHREKVVREFRCPCGKLTCGVGKNKGELKRDFMTWGVNTLGGSEVPYLESVNRKVSGFSAHFAGHTGR